MRRIIITTIITVLGFSVSAFATIIDIPEDYPAIQEGIDASFDGDTVLVQPGTYVENINFNGHNITLGSLFLTTGDTAYISETVIDGDSAGSVIIFENGEDSTTVISGFTLRNGFAVEGGGIYCINSDPLITSNIITNNLAFGNFEDGSGGGIFCDNSNASIIQNIIRENIARQISDEYYESISYGGGIACNGCTQIVISDNIIQDNIADAVSFSTSQGGGVYSFESNPVIIDNMIVENKAGGSIGSGRGGGISTEDSNPVIKNNMVISNSSSGSGGGINCLGLNELPIIENNIIMYNRADSSHGVGGGIECVGVYVIVDRCLIAGNTANYGAGFAGFFFGGRIRNCLIVNNNSTGSGWNRSGAGIHAQNADISIENSTISNNISEDPGAGLHCANAYATITNSIFWNNHPSEITAFGGSSVQISFSDIMGGWQGNGNISADPFFRDPGIGDFHLMSVECGDPYDSPCIDAGSPVIIDSLLDCDWGLGTILSDMGAYGGGDSATVDINDIIERLPSRFTLLQNYPNPFNPSTTIRYSLPEQSDVRIEIYNIIGQKVATLFDGNKQAGYHTVTWKADNYPSGVYFARLETGSQAENIKMVLLK
ncbi:MAG: T9SS type A sorting domain-containing protein [candidate division Zixibacteria bacterium]